MRIFECVEKADAVSTVFPKNVIPAWTTDGLRGCQVKYMREAPADRRRRLHQSHFKVDHRLERI